MWHEKIDVFAHPKWGGETHVFSGEARQRSSSLKENLDVREGDRGGSCRYQSPSLFLFFFWSLAGTVTGPLPKDYTQVGELARF